MVNIVFLNDFCSFRSVAVNSVYKLQFFTFAVLLPVLSRLLILSAALKMEDQKMLDLKMQDQMSPHENAGRENAGPNDGA